ncbi:IclR family transcriptional regulator [Burkholderia guangdongensis]|uniref:IclR family transcriptional regulator n=1 Tax=Burkholderia guangdongensis TaxID=1792500 RepID=UPI0015CE9B1B|nr:IclR family transcriptional regulator [Burkholderia guangdongensis]
MGNPKRNTLSLLPTPIEDHPQFVTALARGMAVLRCFTRGERYLGNQEIAQRTHLPKPTVSRLTFTLMQLGYLHYSVEFEKYSLGVGVLNLGHAFLQSYAVVDVARPFLQAYAEYTQAAVMLGEFDGKQMILLDICQGDPLFQLRLEPGARVAHGSTALGRAHLAALPADLFARYLDTTRAGCPPDQWPEIEAGIVSARDDYERYGFCLSLGDWAPDMFAVGVPMISADRSRILAFNCSGRVSTVTREQLLDDFGPRLVAMRDQVLDRVGGSF